MAQYSSKVTTDAAGIGNAAGIGAEQQLLDWDSQSAIHTRVASIMRDPPLCVHPEMPVEEARELLLEYGLRVAPVVTDGRRPIGIIALRNLVGALAGAQYDLDLGLEERALYAMTSEGIRYPLEDGFHLERLPGTTVADLMMHVVFQLPATASIARAAALMSLEDVSQLVVIGPDGDLCGMVTSDDLTAWIAQETGYWPRKGGWLAVDEPAIPYHEVTAGRKRVLVVEDDAAICEGLVQLLEAEGYAGIRALNGKQALRVLRNLPTRPGLILLDLMMPEMNGWEFRQAQLQDQELRSIPVVVLTASSSTVGVREELRSPAALLHKPIEMDLLLETIATHYGTPSAPN